MKRKALLLWAILLPILGFAQTQKLKSPDGKLELTVMLKEGKASYVATYNDEILVEESALGLVTDVEDFSKDLTWADVKSGEVEKSYTLKRTKQSSFKYNANTLMLALKSKADHELQIEFQVSNNNVAFRYHLPTMGETLSCIVEKETTAFNLPDYSTTFLTPQATPMIGWKRTKPSYEEEYVPDDVLGTPSKYGVGFTFPGLFHVGDKGWVLVSETGVDSRYCASKLSEGTKDGVYSIAFPEPEENNGLGSAQPGFGLPGATPWRTLTISDDLKPIVETTIPFDVVEPQYEASQTYKFGRSTWSWIMWQDWSIVYDDQVAYIDLAAEMGYEYCLIDGLWETQIGYDKMEDLFQYCADKGVEPFVWYNSNGHANDAPQGPRYKMSRSIERKKEMKWLQQHGVKGIKVDFFGGDKQEVMKLYEDILSDANDYGLMVIFHGCTLPRGWERMYPNYIGSEAVLASENLVFQQHFDDVEAYNASLHPFIRNAVGSMEFGPVLLNKKHNRNNDGGNERRTSDVFQIAMAVLFQSPVQMFAIAPNNLTDAPAFAIDFMKKVPTTWDETIYLDGYPGKYVVLARRHGDQWFVCGINAENETKKLKVNLPMLAGQTVAFYSDDKELTGSKKELKVKKSGSVSVTIPTNGAFILSNE